MREAKKPHDEAQRLVALHALAILDSEREQRFDAIVDFACSHFNVPIALINLVDSHRQWVKAAHGLNICETPRSVAFCSHTLLESHFLIVEDALRDPRFTDNPLVRGEPYIRFYAGAPLVLPSGHAVGALCLIDRQPRKIDEVDLVILGKLRDIAVDEMIRRAGEQ